MADRRTRFTGTTFARAGLMLALVAAGGSGAALAQSSLRSYDLATTSQDVTVYGPEAGDRLGSVSLIADLNGDGIGDLVTAARDAQGPSNLRGAFVGEVAIRFGTRGWSRQVDLLASPPNIVVYGEDPGDLLATALATCDLNADGRLDLVMSATSGDGPNNSRGGSGTVYVLYGRNS